MTLGGRICPYCRKYTPKSDARCVHCQRLLGPQWLAGAMRVFAENPVWATGVLASISVFVFFGECLAALATERPQPDVMQLALGSGISAQVLLRFGAVAGGMFAEDYWRLICACYIHMNALHLFFNMFALFDFGRALEPTIKGPRMIVAYTFTGVVGFLVSIWWAPYLTAGASGAVFGVQGVLLGQMLAARDPRFNSFLWRTIGYSVAFYFMMSMRTNQAAHMGGLFSGIALGYIYGKESRPWHREKYFWTVAVLCLVATIGALAFAHWSYLHVPIEG